MISIVLYGRNDNYGHNLHKRAALSLNCMAEVLDADGDEILFVDYNTPDDLPTFPEAIHDVLTARARSLLRVLRVRPALHARVSRRAAAPPVLEAVARNAAIRRSNPLNRWVLSSNTDMILVPQNGRALSAIAADLPDGFFGTPRFEVPESLWETFDRLDPAGVIARMPALAAAFHLNEIVYGSDSHRYDAPGDFQLMLRQDLFAIGGFHEGMRHGWHLDANIARRLGLLRGAIGDALPFVHGYHCDHSRQATHKHVAAGATDSFVEHVLDVTSPQIASQPEDWGCAGEEIEEIRLDGGVNTGHLAALRNAIGEPQPGFTEARFRNEHFNTETVTVAHLLPFLTDQFANAPRDFGLCWLGAQDEGFAAFAGLWPALGFSRALTAIAPEQRVSPETFATADGFVVNFGVPAARLGADSRALGAQILALITAEDARRAAGLPARRVIGVNAVHNDHDRMMRDHFNAARTPFATRLRVGFAAPPPTAPVDWLPEMLTTEHGVRRGHDITMRPSDAPRRTTCIAYGPYRCLRPGHHRLELALRREVPGGWMGLITGALLSGHAEVVVGDTATARCRIHLIASTTRVSLPVVVSDDAFDKPIEVRIYGRGRATFAVTEVTLHCVAPRTEANVRERLP